MNSMKNNKQIQSPFFSVVIPVYNKEPHIARSIESVLNQSFNNFELIIVCDPSTDNSNLEVERFLDYRIRVFYRNEPGPGGYAARNLGIKNAKAEWIAFLDADDEWYLDYLQNSYDLISEFPKSLFIGSGWDTLDPDHSHNIVTSKYFEKYADKENHSISFKDYLSNELYLERPFYTSTVIIKKSILLKSGLFPEGRAKRGGDVDTWLRCANIAKKITVGGYIGACYYRDSINMVSRQSIDSGQALRDSIKSIVKETQDYETIILLKRFSNLYTKRAWIHNLHLDVDNANFNLFKTIYFKVDDYPIKTIRLAALSLLPRNTFLKLLEIKAHIKYKISLKHKIFDGDKYNE